MYVGCIVLVTFTFHAKQTNNKFKYVSNINSMFYLCLATSVGIPVDCLCSIEDESFEHSCHAAIVFDCHVITSSYSGQEI